MPVACDFRLGWNLLCVPVRLPFSAVIEDLFRDLVCALRILLTYPFKNLSIKLVYFVELVYCICFLVQGFAYIFRVCVGFFAGL